jgi:acyl carrier protein
VSLDDVFFDIGGNSLLANQVINRIEQKFNISMPLKQIFTHPTLRWLARSIENSLFIDTITQQKTEVEDYEEFEL